MKLPREKKILITYSLFILVVSILPVGKHKVLPYFPLDKAVHFFLYMLLSAVGVYAFKENRFCIFKAFVYALVFGLLIESIQGFIPYRSFEAEDVLINVLGAGAGIVFRNKLSFLIGRRRRKI